MNRIAHGGPGGDHAHAGGSSGFAGRADAPRELKDPAVEAATLFTHGATITIVMSCSLTCFVIPSVISTLDIKQLTHVFDGFA